MPRIMALFFFVLWNTCLFPLEISKFWLIEEDLGKIELLKKKEKPVFRSGETIHILMEIQKALIKDGEGKLRWSFEFYIEGKLNTRLKPETKTVKQDSESFAFSKVYHWKLPKLSGNYKVILIIQDLVSGKKQQQVIHFRAVD